MSPQRQSFSIINLLLKPLLIMALAFSLFACGGTDAVVDTTDPVITLNGGATITLDVGARYIDAGATATDNVDGDITANITIVNPVDTSTAGTYTITYRVSDNAGNAAIEVTRTVIVVAPTVTLSNLLNDTGITWGGNFSSGNNTDCTGETIGQQDCSHGRDAQALAGALTKVGAGLAGFDFTKLDSSGKALDVSATSWSCVEDNRTGLIWEVKTDTAQGADLHSRNDRYNWYNTSIATNGGADGFADNDGNICTGYVDADGSTATNNPDSDASNCNTQAFVARVNASNGGAGLCGATDWRLPNLNELQSIANLGRSNPAIDLDYFPNTQNSFYWSSSPIANLSNNAWGVHFDLGNDLNNLIRSRDHRVRLVRSGQ